MTEQEGVPPAIRDPLAALVEAYSGLRYTDSRRFEFDSKVTRAFRESDFGEWDDYLRELASPIRTALMERLIEALAIGETHFFRHPVYFERLEREILPERVAARRQTRQLRIWCAGCATGEEAYSLAIIVRRLLPDLADWRIEFIASDLNRSFLRIAEAGSYRAWSFREIDPDAEPGSFVEEANSYRVRPEVRRLVRFAYHNLVSATPPSWAYDLDLILCRNVLMYFRPQLFQAVIGRLRGSLAPGGWLMLGPHDALPGTVSGFEELGSAEAPMFRRALRDAPLAAGDSPSIQQGPDSTENAVGLTLLTQPAISLALADAAAPEPDHLPDADHVQSAEASSEEWQDVWADAYASANRGDQARADLLCHELAERFPLRPEPYYLLGTLRLSGGDEDAALAAFRQALYAEQDYVPALLALASLHRKAGQTERARQALARAGRSLAGRGADELILPEEGLTVGRLRNSLARGLEMEACPEGRP